MNILLNINTNIVEPEDEFQHVESDAHHHEHTAAHGQGVVIHVLGSAI